MRWRRPAGKTGKADGGLHVPLHHPDGAASGAVGSRSPGPGAAHHANFSFAMTQTRTPAWTRPWRRQPLGCGLLPHQPHRPDHGGGAGVLCARRRDENRVDVAFSAVLKYPNRAICTANCATPSAARWRKSPAAKAASSCGTCFGFRRPMVLITPKGPRRSRYRVQAVCTGSGGLRQDGSGGWGALGEPSGNRRNCGLIARLLEATGNQYPEPDQKELP